MRLSEQPTMRMASSIRSTPEQVTSAVFPASTHLPPGGLIIEPYLESHYKLVQVLDGFRIMERKSEAHAN